MPGPGAPSASLDLPAADVRADRVYAGASIRVSVGAGVFTRMVALCYLAPAVLMVIGASLGAALMSDSDLWALAGAAAGLMVGCAMLRLYDSRVSDPRHAEQRGVADRKFPVFLTES